MKKTQLTKLIISIMIGIMLILIATEVHADDNVITDLSNFINSNSSSSSGNSSGTNTNTNSSTNTNTNSSNPLGNNTNSSTTNSNTNSTNSTSSNSSSYNNTNLPKTGIMDSTGAIVLLVVVFVVSALYAYRKINDYRGL